MGFIGLSAFTGKVSAQSTNSKTYVVWCQNCNTYQKFKGAMARPIGSTVYVGDATQHMINAYRIQVEGEKSGRNFRRSPVTSPQVKIVVEITPDPKVAEAIDSAIKFYNISPVGWVKTYEVSIDKLGFGKSAPGSASDVTSAGHDQSVFEDGLNTWGRKKSTLFWLVGTTVQSFANLHLLNISSGPQVRYSVTFPDGSSIEVYYDNQTGKLKVDPNTARDSQGNRIPYLGYDGEMHNLGGGRKFDTSSGGGSQDLHNFLMDLQLNGIPVYEGQGPASGYHGWACVTVGSGANTVYYCKKY